VSRLKLDLRRLGQGLRKLPKWSLLLGGLVLVGLAGVGIWLLIQVWPEAVDETWQRILDSGVLRVCTDPSWPPFEFIDERSGEIKGLDVDLASALAARLRPAGVPTTGSGRPAGATIRAEIVPVGFDSLYDALAAGRCDAVLSALPYEAERTEDVAYALSYFNAGLVIVARDDSTDVGGLASLPGRAVGVEWGFVPEGDGRQRLLLSDLPLRRYDTAGDALRALQAGEIDAALVDQVSALTYLHECQGLRIAGAPLTDVSYVIPVRPDAFRLLEEINRALVEIREDGTMAGLIERWF
jgi:ABC-type amino acid transport substrate-binding protein